MIYGITAVAVLLTGLARTWYGMKGMGWYWHQPLLHFKFGLFIIIGLLSIKPTLTYRRWVKTLDGGGGLPGDRDVRAVRRLVMLQAHLLILIPIAAVMLARGVWTR